jgi:putative peptidoglycan lipid II flippase
MTQHSTQLVAAVLAFFVLGLVPFSLFQLMSRAFYAMQDTKTPFVINCFAVGVNIVVDFPLFFAWGVKGLALAQTIAYYVGIVLQLRVLRRRIHGIDGHRILWSTVRISGAGLVMGGLVWVTFEGLKQVIASTEAGDLLLVTVSIAVGVASYLALANLFKVQEIAYVRSLLARRLSRAS